MDDDEYMTMNSDRTWKWDGCSLPYSWVPSGGAAMIYSDSQFFLAKDGTWLMVDYMPHSGNWYITEGV